jgi:hypothetical protein
VHQVGHYPELHQDARSTKHKILDINKGVEHLPDQRLFNAVNLGVSFR